VIGTFLGPRDDDADRRYAEMEVRSLTGAGAEGNPPVVLTASRKEADSFAPRAAPSPRPR
jgi:hypothetical protein